MKTLLVVIILLLVGIAVLGFNRGWFVLSTVKPNQDPNVIERTDQKPSATITVDPAKFKADEDKAKERVHDLTHKAKETAGDRAETVR